MRVLLLDFQLEIQLDPNTNFPFFKNLPKIGIKGIKVRYAGFLTLLSVFKGAVNVN